MLAPAGGEMLVAKAVELLKGRKSEKRHEITNSCEC